jgi:hypothetical protein
MIAALIRALKTAAQVMLSMLTVGVAITSFNWVQILSISGTSFIYSILTSIVFGIPEGEYQGTMKLEAGDEQNNSAVVLSITTPYDKLIEQGRANIKVEKEN